MTMTIPIWLEVLYLALDLVWIGSFIWFVSAVCRHRDLLPTADEIRQARATRKMRKMA